MRTFSILRSFWAFIGLASLITFMTACGVKAPPLPPESSTPQQADKGAWSPDRATRPSPSPSPSSTPRKE